MSLDSVKNPMTAVQALVVKLGKGRTLRERVRELRWKRKRKNEAIVEVDLNEVEL